MQAILLFAIVSVTSFPSPDSQFQSLAASYVRQFPALSPVTATVLGDHRFDDQLDEISPIARQRRVEFYREYLNRLGQIEAVELSRPNQVDLALLRHELQARLWRLEELQEWAWNPLIYTELSGSAIYGLMARDFAPVQQRLLHVASRLELLPRLLQQVEGTLEARRVPRVHAETAIKQNRGVLSTIDNLVVPQIGQLAAKDALRLNQSIELARQAVHRHQEWLESELLPNANGDYRLGAALYDKKLSFALHTPMTRQQVRERAVAELGRVRREMYRIAKRAYLAKFPFTIFPDSPSEEYRQAIIRAGLEMAYVDRPKAEQVLDTAKASLALTTEFVRKKDLLTIPPDPLEIIAMPEFQRGVSFAYCDSPGPLDVGLKTFYAVSPIPKNWDSQQVDSFLREYNVRSIHDLTVHEAMPGHFVQLALANQYPGKLRSVLASGTFIEGWAVYAEQMMADEGLLDDDPLMKLIARKWYLRGIANAILDQAIHTDGISRDQAMRLMMEDTFQEEREAAAKWTRAQLTAAQLSTYFVGYLEHADLRREIESKQKNQFQIKQYHDQVLSYGSPPVNFVRALMLELPIPQSFLPIEESN
ncbi:MAG: DUF885 domain-containing protein [Planctomycetaceae bacterium]|nr:DUF885 domain-containing protein [Planctomycetaceae bacterium]